MGERITRHRAAQVDSGGDESRPLRVNLPPAGVPATRAWEGAIVGMRKGGLRYIVCAEPAEAPRFYQVPAP